MLALPLLSCAGLRATRKTVEFRVALVEEVVLLLMVRFTEDVTLLLVVVRLLAWEALW